MDINEVLLLTYRYSLLYNIVLYERTGDIINQTSLTLDELEEKIVCLEEKAREKYEKDNELKLMIERSKVNNDRGKESRKKWYNFFL